MLPERILSVMNGRVVDMLHLQPGDVTVEGIADKLAKINRYNGATEYPYSVAQHAVLVSRLLDWDLDSAMMGLHHDDAEAFVGDWISPIKHLPEVLATVRPIENAVHMQILRAFDIHRHVEREILVGGADHDALYIEWEGLGLPRGLGWDPPRVPVEPWHRELLKPMHWRAARDAYIERHRELSCET